MTKIEQDLHMTADEQDHNSEKDTTWRELSAAHSQFLDIFRGKKEAVVDRKNTSPMMQALIEHRVKGDAIFEVACIDERCPNQGEGNHLGLGGAGILVPEEQQEGYVSYLVETALRQGVKTIQIHSHEGCGAAKLSLGNGEHSADKVNAQAQHFTNQLAEKVLAELVKRGRSDIEVVSGYSSFEDMHAPNKFHNAVGIVVNTTEHFDPTRKKDAKDLDLPPFFNINGTYDYAHSMANVVVALGIAFGDHGFGPKHFSKERPFVVTLVHSSDETAQELAAQLEETVSAFVSRHKEQKSEDLQGLISVKILKYEDKNDGTVEQLSLEEQAFQLTKEVLGNASKVQALRESVGKYTENLEVEFTGISRVLESESSKVFSTYRGVEYMLWGKIVEMLRKGENITAESLSEKRLQDMISQAYQNSASSGI